MRRHEVVVVVVVEPEGVPDIPAAREPAEVGAVAVPVPRAMGADIARRATRGTTVGAATGTAEAGGTTTAVGMAAGTGASPSTGRPRTTGVGVGRTTGPTAIRITTT